MHQFVFAHYPLWYVHTVELCATIPCVWELDNAKGLGEGDAANLICFIQSAVEHSHELS